MRQNRARTSFGKLWKVMIQFSRTCNVLEKESFSRMASENFWVFVWKDSKIPSSG